MLPRLKPVADDGAAPAAVVVEPVVVEPGADEPDAGVAGAGLSPLK